MAKFDISNIDGNLKISTDINEENITFYSVRKKPFKVYGLFGVRDGSPFKRMPVNIAESVSDSVKSLNFNTAGGRLRFSTDSAYIAIKALMPSLNHMAHMPLSGSGGFDMYVDGEYSKTFIPPTKLKDGYDGIHYFSSKKQRFIEINFPLYNPVDDLFIGLESDATLDEGAPYKYKTHVVYYGSSITQGGCASRPGNAYPAVISRKVDCNYINFGFSGSALAEDEIVNYIADLEMGVFVCDYDHNAPNAAHLESTHEKLYKTIRAKNSDLPIIFVSRPNTDFNKNAAITRRDIIYRTFINAQHNGDDRVSYIDGASLFMGEYRDCCTVDGLHPNDLGFIRMAEIIGREVERCLKGVS